LWYGRSSTQRRSAGGLGPEIPGGRKEKLEMHDTLCDVAVDVVLPCFVSCTIPLAENETCAFTHHLLNLFSFWLLGPLPNVAVPLMLNAQQAYGAGPCLLLSDKKVLGSANHDVCFFVETYLYLVHISAFIS
jgi:hypothetical protein